MKLKFVFVLALVVVISGAITSQAQSVGHLRMPASVARPTAPESGQVSAAPVGDATSACSFTFTNPGKFNSGMEFCVTVNGNITSFQSPIGIEYINQGGVGEGYGICDLASNVAYFDYAQGGDSGNWNPTVTVSSTATSVKFTRTTADGLFTLTQVITKVGGPVPYAKMTMSVKNNLAAHAKTIILLRYADVDPANAPQADTSFLENFDSTQTAAWGNNSVNFGLMLESIGLANVPEAQDGFDLNTASPPNPCSFSATWPGGPETNIDGSVEMVWELALKGLQTGTVNAKYEQF